MPKQSIDMKALVNMIEGATNSVQAKVAELQGRGDNIGVADMFEMQMVMNEMTTLAEMSTSIAAAQHGALKAMTQNIR